MIDETSANAHTAWVRMEKPRPPSPEERAALQEASRLKAEELGGELAVGGAVELTVSMGTHSICLLELVPL
jgi:hypothetical protein